MKKGSNLLLWFHNHSIRFKMVTMLFVVVAVLQLLNGLIFISLTSGKFEDNILTAKSETVSQIAYNMNRSMVDIVNEMVPIRDTIYNNQGTLNREAYITRNIVYQKQFDTLLATNNNYQFIHSMLIWDEVLDEQYVYTKSEYLTVNREDFFQKIVQEYDLVKQCHWSKIISAGFYFQDRVEPLISIIMPLYRYNRVTGLLIVNLDEKALQKYLQDLGQTEELYMLQINDTDIIWGSTLEASILSDEDKEKICQYRTWDDVEKVGHSVVVSDELPINQWRISLIAPQKNITTDASVLTQYIMVVIVTTGIILLFSATNIVFIITKPIKKMTEIMEANRHNPQIDYRFHAKYKDEVGVLSKTYNKLMDEVTDLMRDIKKEQEENRKTYQRMLQMQIKPHFLYNTLESAKFLVEMGDPRGSEMLTIIGKFYEGALSGADEFVTVAEEIRQLEYYLQILKLRYESRYDYSIQIEEEILQNEMIRFSLQPLAENAIYHGLKQQRKKGFLKIIGYVEDEKVSIVIWDNGIGIQPEKLKELQEMIDKGEGTSAKEHIGVANVHQRIRTEYGDGYGLKISSQVGMFTRVEMVLPIKKRR